MKNWDAHSEASKTWFRNMYHMLNEGGRWGVPRSGLMFQKRAGKFICTERLPHIAVMTLTPEQWRDQQDWDFNGVRECFAAIGITVEDHSKEVLQ